MYENALLYPSLLMVLCLVLVVCQLARLLRALILTRQSWLRYLPLVIPVSLVALAFPYLDASAQLQEDLCGPPNPENFCPIGQLHWNATSWHAYISHFLAQYAAPFLLAYQVFIPLLLACFLGMLFLEYRCLPRVQRPPVWERYSHLW